MNGYNPMIDYQRNRLLAQQATLQQQLANLEQMNPQMSYQMPTPQPPQTQYFTREVDSFEEAKRVVPNPCEVYVFLDGKAGKIYLKQMNTDTGRSDYLIYNLDTSGQNVPKDPMAIIDERLEKIENFLGGLKNESISGNAENEPGGDKSNGGFAGTNNGEVPEAKSAAVQNDSANAVRKKR